MQELTTKLTQVVSTHFKNQTIKIEMTRKSDVSYEIRFDKRLNVTNITVFPRVIDTIIRENFTLLERMINRENIENAAVMVMVSTIHNLTHSRPCIQAILNTLAVPILTETDYAKRKDELRDVLDMLSKEVIPFKDRNKYVIQPNIDVNYKSKLLLIFSRVEILNFMRMIGYRPEKREGAIFDTSND